MIKKILVIDPFIKQPVNNCYNRLVDLLPAKLYLFQPAFFPMDLYCMPPVDAYIILGSASHVHENIPWHISLKDFIVSELKAKKAVLGLCFGHQLIGHHFGAKVEFLHKDESKILGSRPVIWNNQSYTLGISHKQGITKLSNELEELMPGSKLGFDLIRHKTLPFLGCQAHPEASEKFLLNDCQIKDYSVRKNILDQSSKFLLNWYQNFIQ